MNKEEEKKNNSYFEGGHRPTVTPYHLIWKPTHAGPLHTWGRKADGTHKRIEATHTASLRRMLTSEHVHMSVCSSDACGTTATVYENCLPMELTHKLRRSTWTSVLIKKKPCSGQLHNTHKIDYT